MEVNQNLKKRGYIIKFLNVISFIPLIIYPILLLANLMSFFGHRSGNESIFLIVSSYSFLIFSSMYPFTLIYSIKNNKSKRIIIALLPILHVIVSILLCFVWMIAEE